MQTFPNAAIERGHHYPVRVVVPGAIAVAAAVVLGAVNLDPAQRSSVVVIGAFGLLALPAGALIGDGRRFPWAAAAVVGFVGACVGALHGTPGPLGGGGVRTTVVDATIGTVLVALVVSEAWMLRSRPAYEGHVSDRHSGLAIAVAVAGAFGGALAVADVGCGPAIATFPWPLYVVGIALAVGGLTFRLWAVATLGRFFQPRLVVQHDHRLVTDGPYRLVRHPSYLGPILMLLGVGLVGDRWIGLAICTVLPVAAYAYRIVVEEHLLVSGLGPPYQAYRGRTWRLAPGIW
ncbi:MAG TPA: isoprenylcysteine carboxylmethyltransferase family protein [Acidimicrobiales bacterium]